MNPESLAAWTQRYQRARTAEELLEVVFGLHQLLDRNCTERLQPRLGLAASKLTLSQKVSALLPAGEFDPGRVETLQREYNRYRLDAAGVSAERAAATAWGYIDLGAKLLPGQGLASPVSARPASTRSAKVQGKPPLPWPAILFASGLVIAIAVLGGFFQRPAPGEPAIGAVSIPATPTAARQPIPTRVTTPTPTLAPPTATAAPTHTPPPATPTPTPSTPTLTPTVATPTGASTATTAPITPTPTPTVDTPTPVVSADLRIGAQVIVQANNSGVNIRRGPGLDQEVILRLPEGAALTIIGGPQDASGLTWWQVQAPGLAEGWCAGGLLRTVSRSP